MGTALTWRVAYCRRVAPGALGLLALAAVPALFLVPLDAGGLFQSRAEASRALLWIAAFGLAGGLARDAGRPRPACLWIFQTGVSVPDYLTREALLSAGLGLAIVGWWVMAWSAVHLFGGTASLADTAGMAVLGAGTFALACACMFPLAAARVGRATDLLVLAALASVLRPALFGADSALGRAAELVLPPFPAVAAAARHAAGGGLPDAAGAMLHPVLYGLGCVALGLVALGRWRPGSRS